MGYKEELSNNYINNLKSKYLNDYVKPINQIFVTGACGNNICGTMSDKFKNLGMDVTNCDIRMQRNVDLQLNLTDDSEIEILADQLSFINSNVLILGHSITDLKWYEDYDFSEYDNIISSNLLSHMKIINRWVKKTIDKKYKKYIIIIGSMAYDNVLNGSIPYMVSKAGIAMLVRGLAWELAPKNYNVIGIHPSNTLDTPMTQETIENIMKFRNISYEDAYAYWSAVLPKSKFLTKDEIFEISDLFISGKCDYLSGSNIELRGGQR